MFKYAALASIAVAHEFEMYTVVGGPGTFPAVTTPMTFEQNAGTDNFAINMS